MKLDMLEDKYWGGVKELLLFGYGKQGQKILKTLRKDFRIVGIVDNNVAKSGLNDGGIPILQFSEAKDLLKKYKIVVTAAEFHYKQIKKQLQDFGLVENRDFVMYQTFIMEWYYKYKSKVYILKTDVFVTSSCSLKCKNCVLFIPYWKNNISVDLEQLKEDAKNYFRCVDFVLDMNIVGGEAFLYKNLNELLCWYGENYRHQIGHLGIITNGTIIPKESTIAIMKKYGIVVSISDYSDTVGYKVQVDKLCETLQINEVEYIRNTDIQWFDFGFPQPKYCYTDDRIKAHMESCNTICHMLSDNTLWYCSNAWTAYKSGLYPNAYKENIGYVKLDEIDEHNPIEQKRILDCCSGNMGNGYVEFCRVCGGYGADNQNKVKTAEQLR